MPGKKVSGFRKLIIEHVLRQTILDVKEAIPNNQPLLRIFGQLPLNYRKSPRALLLQSHPSAADGESQDDRKKSRRSAVYYSRPQQLKNSD